MIIPDILQEDFQYRTNLKERVIATILDYALFLLPTYFYIMFFGQNNDEGGKTVTGFMALIIPAYWFVYFVFIEAHYGATIGHQGLSLKVISADRKNIGLRQAFKRHLLDPFEIFCWGIPAIIAILNSNKHQRVGDMWARTIVVNTKDPVQYYIRPTSKP